MIELLITSSVLILTLSALRYLFRGRVSPCLGYALWLLVALRLLLPFSLFESNLSVMAALPQAAASGRTAAAPLVAPGEEAPAATLPAASGQAAPTPSQPVEPEQPGTASARQQSAAIPWPTLLWAAGALLLAACLLTANLCFAARLRHTRLLLCHAAAGRRRLPVYLAPDLPSPCLFGVLRPAVYLNQAAAPDETRRQYSIAHELAHFRHGDHIWALLRSVCLCLYWFHPLVWLAALLSRRDAELACDAAVLATLDGAQRLAYGRVLLDLVAARQTPAERLACATMMRGGGPLRERVSLIARRPKTLALAAVVVLLAAAAAAACTFSGARQAVFDPAQAYVTAYCEPSLSWRDNDHTLRFSSDTKDVLAEDAAQRKLYFIYRGEAALDSIRVARQREDGAWNLCVLHAAAESASASAAQLHPQAGACCYLFMLAYDIAADGAVPGWDGERHIALVGLDGAILHTEKLSLPADADADQFVIISGADAASPHIAVLSRDGAGETLASIADMLARADELASSAARAALAMRPAIPEQAFASVPDIAAYYIERQALVHEAGIGSAFDEETGNLAANSACPPLICQMAGGTLSRRGAGQIDDAGPAKEETVGMF